MKPTKLGQLFMLAVTSFAAISISFADGGSSGGGGFYQKSPVFLIEAALTVSQEVSKIDPAKLASIMPSAWQNGGWTREKLASVLENVCQEQTTFRSRDGKGLVFDYCNGDATSPSCQNSDCAASGSQYISALAPYFQIAESHPLEDLKLRLIHEAVHLLGVGTGKNNDADAQVLAKKIEGLVTAPTPIPQIPAPNLSQGTWTKVEFDCKNLTPFFTYPNYDWDAQTVVKTEGASSKIVFERNEPLQDTYTHVRVRMTLTGNDGTVLASAHDDQGLLDSTDGNISFKASMDLFSEKREVNFNYMGSVDINMTPEYKGSLSDCQIFIE